MKKSSCSRTRKFNNFFFASPGGKLFVRGTCFLAWHATKSQSMFYSLSENFDHQFCGCFLCPKLFLCSVESIFSMIWNIVTEIVQDSKNGVRIKASHKSSPLQSALKIKSEFKKIDLINVNHDWNAYKQSVIRDFSRSIGLFIFQRP